VPWGCAEEQTHVRAHVSVCGVDALLQQPLCTYALAVFRSPGIVSLPRAKLIGMSPTSLLSGLAGLGGRAQILHQWPMLSWHGGTRGALQSQLGTAGEEAGGRGSAVVPRASVEGLSLAPWWLQG